MSHLILITSGGSQLLTQIATCFELKMSLTKGVVVYIGDRSERLKPVLKEICSVFGLTYIGELPNLNWPIKLKKSKWSLFYSKKKRVLNHGHNLRDYILDRYSFLAEYQGAILILPIRHKMFSDILLVHAIGPSKLILTADGVVNNPSSRSGSDKRLLGIDTPINKFPIEVPIYSPKYLFEENQKLGKVITLKDEILNRVFEKATTSYFKDIFRNIFKDKKLDYIIFSQHLSLSKVCSDEEEQKYYRAIIRDLRRRDNCKIIIKLHPRETEEKVKGIINSGEDIFKDIEIIPITMAPIPVELMMSFLKESTFVTANSSAPLSVRKGNKIICYSYANFSEYFKQEIRGFAKLNDCNFREL